MSGTLPPHASPQNSCNSLNRKVELSNDQQAILSGDSNAERPILNTRTSGEPSDANKCDIEGNRQTAESHVTKAGGLDKLSSDGMSNRETSLGITGGLNVVSPASEGFVESSKSCDPNMDQVLSHNSKHDVQGLYSGLSSPNIFSHADDTCCTPGSDNMHFISNFADSFGGKLPTEENQYSADRVTWPALWEETIVDDLLNLDCEQPKCSKGFNNLSPGISLPGMPLNLEQSSRPVWQQDEVGHHSQSGKASECFDNGTCLDDETSTDMVESSIISNILSLEMDVWEDSLGKLLGESDGQCTSSKAAVSWKSQDKNQSRFSFARQDEFVDETSEFDHSFGIAGHASTNYFSPGGSIVNESNLTGKGRHDFSSNSPVDSHVGSQSCIPSACSGEC